MILALMLLLALTACTPLPAPSPPPVNPTRTPVELPPAAAGPPDQAAPALIAAEREAARAGDLQMLAALWTADAQIIDGRGTDKPADDYRWQGRSAILDRYVIAVFPVPPPPLDPAWLDSLNVITGTDDTIYAELGVDRWTFVRRNGQWRLSELRYN